MQSKHPPDQPRISFTVPQQRFQIPSYKNTDPMNLTSLTPRKPTTHLNTLSLLTIFQPTRHPSLPTSQTMANSFTAHELKSWIDSIPYHLLAPHPTSPDLFPTTHPIYADANCRLVVQDKTRDAYILRVQINSNCPDPVLAALKQGAPWGTPAWCVVPRDRGWGAEEVRIALKRHVEG